MRVLPLALPHPHPPPAGLAGLRRRCGAVALALTLSLGTVSCGGPDDGPTPAPAAGPTATPDSDALPAPAPPRSVRGRKLLEEASSPFSKIRVRQQGTRRSLGFVRARGDEFVQTIVDLAEPDAPAHAYIEAMAAPLLVVDDPQRLLLIGLGGGTMVRWLHPRLPRARLDAVEIDPEVVRLAAKWFGVVPGPRLRVITDDGVRFIAAEGESYDIIWLDAFLDPGRPGTDNAGVPDELRGLGFLERVRARLRPGGVAAFNIHFLTGYREHVDAIATVFPRTYVVRADKSNELIVLALTRDVELGREALRTRAAALAASGPWGSSPAAIAEAIEPWQPTPR